jgi:hypothetical protein
MRVMNVVFSLLRAGPTIPPLPAVRQRDDVLNAVKLAYRPGGPESTGYAGDERRLLLASRRADDSASSGGPSNRRALLDVYL